MTEKEASNYSRREFLIKSCLMASALSLPTFAQTKPEEYDFIVIGSGAGGGPLACNLAIAGFKVLILEAGGKKISELERVPALHAASTEDPMISWHYYVKHYNKELRQRDDWKYVEKKGILYPRASGLGGCTLHHAMITLYPFNEDWEHLAKITKDSSFDPNNMRKLWQKIERCGYRTPTARNPSKSGFNGWLSTEQTPLSLLFKDQKFLNIVLSSARAMGITDQMTKALARGDYSFFLDPNDWEYVKRKQEGLFHLPKATKNGYRHGPREYILETMKKYPKNLHLKTHSLVSKIVLNEDKVPKALGVEYMEGSNLYEASMIHDSKKFGLKKFVKARREVLVCGGAFNSPQLLMLSGIGDRNHISKKGIKPRVHLPGVGKNLQDRYEVGVVSELHSPFQATKDCTFLRGEDPCFRDFVKDPKNTPYGTNGVLIGIMKKSKPYRKNPDLFIFGVPGDFRGYYPGWSRDSVKTRNKFTWLVLKGKTNNTAGYVKLKSKDPRQMPEINFNYFDEGNGDFKQDLYSVTKGIDLARKINSYNPLASMIKKEVLPGKRYQGFDKDYVLEQSWGHHASCSNKIGNNKDPMAVLDGQFRVRGTRNLRVVDASSFSKIPGLFIVVPIYMLAEKASQDILKDHT